MEKPKEPRPIPSKEHIEKRPPMPEAPDKSAPHKGQPDNADEYGGKQQPVPQR
jgi:hypothetical protein